MQRLGPPAARSTAHDSPHLGGVLRYTGRPAESPAHDGSTRQRRFWSQAANVGVRPVPVSRLPTARNVPWSPVPSPVLCFPAALCVAQPCGPSKLWRGFAPSAPPTATVRRFPARRRPLENGTRPRSGPSDPLRPTTSASIGNGSYAPTTAPPRRPARGAGAPQQHRRPGVAAGRRASTPPPRQHARVAPGQVGRGARLAFQPPPDVPGRSAEPRRRPSVPAFRESGPVFGSPSRSARGPPAPSSPVDDGLRGGGVSRETSRSPQRRTTHGARSLSP